MTVREATGRPCSACPWRTSNQGLAHPGHWYTRQNLRRLWAGLRRGEFMSCHKTDPRNPVPAGLRGVPEGAVTRDCSGALIVQQREVLKIQESIAATGGLRAYSAANPRGMTRAGAAQVVFRAMTTWPGEVPMTRPNLNDPEIGHPDLTWEPR